MKHVIRAVLLTLAWLCVLAGGRLSAQQVRLPDESIVADQPEVISPGAPLSAKVQGSGSKSTNPASKPGAGVTAQGASPDGTGLTSVFSEEPVAGYLTASPQPEQTAVYNGGIFGRSTGTSCEMCGEGNQAPPAWYIHQGVQFMQRSGLPNNLKKPLVDKDTTEEDPATPDVDLPHWEQTQTDPDLYTWSDSRNMWLPVFNTQSFEFDTSTGYTVTVGHYLGRDADNRDHFVEFGYAGMNTWSSQRTINGVVIETHYPATDVTAAEKVTAIRNLDGTLSFLNSPRPSSFRGSLETPYVHSPSIASQFTETQSSLDRNFNHVLTNRIFYRSDLDGDMELNARIRPRGRADRLVLLPNGQWQRQCQPGHQISYLFGLRFMSIDESFGLSARGTTQFPIYDGPKEIGDLSSGSVIGYEVLGYNTLNQAGDYFVRTHNDLFGLQVGGEFALRRCKWTAGARGKAGPYINFSDQSTRITTLDAVDIRRFAERESLSIVGEFGFFGSYKIRPNLVASVAYDMRWVSGLALAPAQVTFEPDPPNEINNQGFTFYQGLTLGLECMW